MSVEGINSTSLIILWVVRGNVTVDNFTLSYTSSNTSCVTDSRSVMITGNKTKYEISGLQEATQYYINVTLQYMSNGSRVDSIEINTTTLSDGLLHIWYLHEVYISCLTTIIP